jgi:hypothetical protein
MELSITTTAPNDYWILDTNALVHITKDIYNFIHPMSWAMLENSTDDYWILDTSASHHITKHLELLHGGYNKN